MSTLIPQISISEFKKLKVPELKRLKCCEVYADGEYLFTYIRPNTDYIRVQSEYMGELSNGLKGETLEEILATVRV